MLTKVTVDEKLLRQAQKAGGHRTKREAVTAALREYIGRRRQREILSLFGKVDYDPHYDYKREHNRKPT